MNQLLRYISILILLFISSSVFAQESECAFKLQEAEDAYETGDLDSIPSMLRSCINNDGFDNEELARAYKLLIKTYLFDDYQEMAELTMLKFLKKFPEYEIRPTDPVEFTYLYESYQTVPLYSVGIIVGLNTSFVSILESYVVGSTHDYSADYTSNGMVMQMGIQLKRYINENIEINLDGIYTFKRFQYEIIQNAGTTVYDERQSVVSVPLTGTYDFNLGRWIPYVRAGVNLDYMLSAVADFNYLQDGLLTTNKETNVDIIKDRNSYNFSAVVGGGVKLTIPRGYIMADVRYHYGLLNIYGDNRNDDLKNDLYFYKDDDFALSNLFVSVGFVYPIYKTKKGK